MAVVVVLKSIMVMAGDPPVHQLVSTLFPNLIKGNLLKYVELKEVQEEIGEVDCYV